MTLDAFWTEMHASREGMIESLRHRLEAPVLNAMCTTHSKFDDEIGEQWHARTTNMAKYRPSFETFFKDMSRSGAHADRESLHALRFYIYRYGGSERGIDFSHMWAKLPPVFNKQRFPKMEAQCIELESKVSEQGRQVVMHYVKRSIQRTGGLKLWREVSRFQDRRDCFEAGYDELPEFCDKRVLGELGKSVSIENIHALDTNPATMDKSDKRHAYREFNRTRFLINCEAACQWLFENSDAIPCLWATRQVWRTAPRNERILAVEGLPDSLQDIPGRPFGIDGERDRSPVSMGPAPKRFR